MDLSVIIPLFNAEQYLDGLIDNIVSLNSEASFLYEIVLVDDGSEDDTKMRCENAKNRYPFIQYVRKPNGGIAAARNAGLELAHGEYVTFVDQDDELTQGYEAFLRQCKSQQLDLLITTPSAIDSKGNRVATRQFKEEVFCDPAIIKGTARKLIDNEILRNPKQSPTITSSVWNCFFRRGLLVNGGIRFKRFIDYEDDWIFMIETVGSSNRIATTNESFYTYHVRSQSESHRSKYIVDLCTRRKEWMEWLRGILLRLDTPEIEINTFFLKALKPRNILICFKNACFRPDFNILSATKEVQQACGKEGWELRGLSLSSMKEMSNLDRFWLFLLIIGWIRPAIFLNRKMFKKRFH